MPGAALLAMLAVVLVAGLMTGMTGFGFSVLSVPLLVLVYSPQDVVVIVLCLVPLTSIALLLTPHLRGCVQLGLCTKLSVLSFLGLPVGVLLLRHFDSTWLTGLMGLVLVVFAAFSLYSPADWRLPNGWVIPSGVLGGLLATSTGLSGPAVAMYVHGRRVAHDQVVATMAAYVGVVSILGLAIIGMQGEVTTTALSDVGWLTPIALVGVAVGRWWARKNHQRIERIALHALGLMGLWTLLRPFFG